MSDPDLTRSPRFSRGVQTLTGGRSRRLGVVVGLLVLTAGVYACRDVGRFMAHEDPLAHADAIFVLAGTRVERPLEAADLYLAGYAPRIVLTRAADERDARAVAAQRGADVVTDYDASVDLLQSLGIPSGAVIGPERAHDNTAEEAATLRELAVAAGWGRVIVVSSRYHLRRTALACRRALRGTDVTIVVRGTRYDTSTPERWWTRRADIRGLASEIPKLVAYAIGAGG